jgi:glycosyltransferase 2 family protein
MKKFHFVNIVLGSILFLFLVRQIGIAELWQELKILGWGLVPLVLIEGVADIFHSLGWRHCLAGPLRSMPLFRVFRIRMAGVSINYLTPTATLGGEVTKGTLLSSNHRGTEAATSVIIGKLAYTLAQLLFVALGSIFTLWGIDLPTGVWPAMLASSALLATGIFAFLLVQKYGKLGALVRWLVAHNIGGKMAQKAAHHVTEIDDDLREFYQRRPFDLPIAMLWHTIGLTCGIVQSWYFLTLLTDQVSLRVAAGIWFLGTWFDFITFAIPLGIGIQEATRVLAFNAVGFGSLMGLTYGVTLRIEQIFWAGVGLLCYALLLSEKGAKDPSTSSRPSLPFCLPKCGREKE